MIPAKNIVAWGNVVPWADQRQVEQDLIISRALVEIFSDEMLRDALRFRGGTALNKLHFPASLRYSEDIDPVRTSTGPIGPILGQLRVVLEPSLGQAQFDQSPVAPKIRFRAGAEDGRVMPVRSKIEINTRDIGTFDAPAALPLEIANPWFSNEAAIPTFSREEMLATKLRSAFPRTLFGHTPAPKSDNPPLRRPLACRELNRAAIVHRLFSGTGQSLMNYSRSSIYPVALREPRGNLKHRAHGSVRRHAGAAQRDCVRLDPVHRAIRPNKNDIQRDERIVHPEVNLSRRLVQEQHPMVFLQAPPSRKPARPFRFIVGDFDKKHPVSAVSPDDESLQDRFRQGPAGDAERRDKNENSPHGLLKQRTPKSVIAH